jgi:hypothetical protein
MRSYCVGLARDGINHLRPHPTTAILDLDNMQELSTPGRYPNRRIYLPLTIGEPLLDSLVVEHAGRLTSVKADFYKVGN